METRDPAIIKERLARGDKCTFVVKRHNLAQAMQFHKRLPQKLSRLITLKVED